MAVLVQLDYTNGVFIGQSPNITVAITGEATNWTITYEFGSHSGVIGTRTSIKDFKSFKWPTTFYYEIPTATEGSGVILVDCFKVDTFIGTAAFPFTVKANVSTIAPTISVPTITDANTLATMYTGDNKKLIRYVSTAAISVITASHNGAYMRSVRAINSDRYDINIYSGEETRVTFEGEITGIENGEFKIVATDSRDLTTTISYKVADENIIPYIKPTCNVGDELPDTSGTIRLTCSGNYYTGEFATGVNNYLTVQCRYKEKDGTYSEWQPMTISSASNNKYKAYITLTGLDYRKLYIFECQAIDAFMTVTSAEKTAQALPLFHWGENDFIFEIPVTFNAGLSVPSDESEPAVTGLWTPMLTTSEAVNYYSTQRGWYVKIGNIVMVGFNVAVNCNSGYNSTAIAISGLPFTPAASAFGGGVMFGAYVIAGFCFEGWAAATNGNITPRLQPCNNTSASNLQISSTAYYPNGAANMTLGGTIIYLTD